MYYVGCVPFHYVKMVQSKYVNLKIFLTFNLISLVNKLTVYSLGKKVHGERAVFYRLHRIRPPRVDSHFPGYEWITGDMRNSKRTVYTLYIT